MPGENLVGELNGGWTIAKFLLGNERVGVAPVRHHQAGAGPDQGAGRGPVRRRPAAAGPDRRARERAARPRADRDPGRRATPPTASRTRPPRCSSSRAASSSRRSASWSLDLAGPAALASGAERRLATSTRGQRSPPRLPQPPQGLHLRRLQRGPAPDHLPHDPGALRGRRWTSPTTTSRSPSATPCAAWSARPTPTTRTAARRAEDDPGFDEKLWARMAEMGLLGLPFAEEDGGVGAGPVEIGIVCQELGRVIAPEPYLTSVVLAGGLVSACGTAEQRAGGPRRAAGGRERARLRARRAGPRLEPDRRAGHRQPRTATRGR